MAKLYWSEHVHIRIKSKLFYATVYYYFLKQKSLENYPLQELKFNTHEFSLLQSNTKHTTDVTLSILVSYNTKHEVDNVTAKALQDKN